MYMRQDADSEHLKEALTNMLDKSKREAYSEALKKLTEGEMPAKKIAQILFVKSLENEGSVK